jgi:3-oxoacyl-[acyl-carrier protein] reductase
MTKILKYKKAIVLGGSSGIGREIAKYLKLSCKKVHALSSKDIDTSDMNSVRNFNKKFKKTDILILNSGGPPNIPFEKIDEETWYRYFNQLFLSYCMILKNIKINNCGYIFYISSSVIKEPSESLVISSSLRVAFSSILKSLSKSYSSKNISVINIAPGPFKTRRVKQLIGDHKDLKKYEKLLPTKKIGEPKEIGTFVNFIVKNQMRYLSGSTIYMDGNLSKSFL